MNVLSEYQVPDLSCEFSLLLSLAEKESKKRTINKIKANNYVSNSRCLQNTKQNTPTEQISGMCHFLLIIQLTNKKTPFGFFLTSCWSLYSR